MRLPRQRVLLIEDNEDDYVILRDLLTDITTVAIEVEWISTYEAAYTAFTQGKYDVCLLDYQLGAYTGLELLQALPAANLPPVILLTGNEDYRVDVAATQAGASDYLIKGHINAPLLERAIRYAIQRKASEAALLQAEQFAQATVDALPYSIAVLDERGIIVAVNAAWRDFAQKNGYVGVNSGVGENYLTVCDASDSLDSRATAIGIRKVIVGDSNQFSLEYPCHSPHEQRWYEVRVTPFANSGPLHVVVAHENITERKQAEETSSLLATIVESSEDAIISKTLDGIIMSWNAGAEKLYGYTAHEAIGRLVSFLAPSELSNEMLELLGKIQQGEQIKQYETVRVRKDGSRFDVSLSISALKNAEGVLIGAASIKRDITDRKQAEDVLRASNEKFSQLANNIEDVFWVRSPDMRELQYISPAVERIWGRSVEDMISNAHQWHEFVVPEDRERTLEAFAKLQQDAPSISCEHRIVRPNGDTRWIHTRGFQVRNDAGELIRLTGVASDITARKQAEATRFEREQEFEMLVENSPDIISRFDRKFRHLYVNQVIAQATGVPASAFVGKTHEEMGLPQHLQAKWHAILEDVFSTGQERETEFEFPTPAGPRFYLSRLVPEYAGDGHIRSVLNIARDITERKQAELALRESEDRFRQISGQLSKVLDSSLDAICSFDAEGRFVQVSAACEEIWGYKAKELIGTPYIEKVLPEDQPLTNQAALDIMAGQATSNFENRYVRKDGTVTHIVWSAWWSEAEQCMFCVARDNTEAYHAREALRESESRFSGAFEYAPIGVALVSPQGQWLRVNHAVCNLLGYSQDEMLVRTFQDITHPDDLEDNLESMKRLLAGEIRSYQMEKRYFHSRGHIVTVSLSVSLIRDSQSEPLYFISQIQDISERKRTEEALRRNEALFRTLINSSWDAFQLVDLGGQITYESPAVTRLLGYEPEEMVGHKAIEFVHPDDAERLMTEGMAFMDSLGAKRTAVLRVRHKNGSWRWVESFEVNLLDNPDVGAVAVNYHDITDRKLAEESLQEREHELRTVIEAMPQIVWVTRPDGWHIDFNQKWMDYTGLTLEESLGFGWNSPFHPEDRPRAAKLWQEATASGKPYHIEYRLRGADGSYRWMLGRALPMRDVTGTIVKWFGTSTDIQDLKLAEDGLRESEERFQSIVANVPGMVYQCLLRPNGTVEFPFISEGSRELFELEPDGVRHSPDSLIDEAERAEYLRSIEESAANLTPWKWEGRLRLASGQSKHIQGASRPHRLPDGSTLWDGLMLDITARKEAEIERDRFFTLSLDMLAIIGSDGYMKRLNPAFEATLGFSEAEMMAVPFLEFVHPDDIAHTLERTETLRSGIAVTDFDNRYRCHDGCYRWLRWTCAPFEDIWYCVAHDITESKQVAAALQEANDELETRVEERTAELQSQVLERERAEREVRAQARQHEAVADLGRRALLDLDLDTLLNGAVALIASTLELDVCLYWERLPNSDTLRLRAGISDEQSIPDKTIGDGSQIGYSALTNELVSSQDLEQETRFQISQWLVDIGITSQITVPVHNEVLYGILSACSPDKKSFSQNEIYFLQAVANVLASALSHKHAEAEILQLNSNLHNVNEELQVENIQHQMTMETLRQVADALQLSKEEAERAMQEANAANLAKSEFLSRMSHELRTPLNAILGYGQVLGMRDHVPDIGEPVEAILKGGRHLLDLINEVLDISRIEAGHLSLSLEPVAVSSTTRVALDLVRPLSTLRGIELVNEDSDLDADLDADLDVDLDAERYVFADQQRFKQVLVNLLSNAIKYNREHGQIFVSTARVPGESVKYGDYGDIECSGKMRFCVRDTGPGIAASDLAKIFLPFERLGAERTGVEGTGIGLSLCKRLVEAMNGEIGVESERGVGSTFWVELPLIAADQRMRSALEEPTALPDAAPRQEAQNVPEDVKTILYIEDNISNFAVVKHSLALQNRVINLIAAEQGSVGLDLARSHQPDLILLDLHLPDIMGDVVLHRLQAEPSTSAIPVIVLSADATPRQIERLLAAGAAAYLTKPLDLKQFLRVVEQSLTGRKN